MKVIKLRMDLSKEIFEKINTVVESALKDILNDISKRYDIELNELEREYMNIVPKKKLNGYNKYNSKRRKELLEKNSKLDFGEMSKIIGKEWAQLSDKEKSSYK